MKRNGVDVQIVLEPHPAIFRLSDATHSSVTVGHEGLAIYKIYLMGYHQHY